MTLEQLRAEYPDVVAQVFAEARAETIAAARRRGKEEGITEAATAERTRILGIVGHAEAEGRRPLAIRLASMPDMTIESASELLAGTSKVVAPVGPDEEFRAVMAKARPTPIDNRSDEDAFVARMQAFDEQDRAARAELAQASHGEG